MEADTSSGTPFASAKPLPETVKAPHAAIASDKTAGKKNRPAFERNHPERRNINNLIEYFEAYAHADVFSEM